MFISNDFHISFESILVWMVWKLFLWKRPSPFNTFFNPWCPPLFLVPPSSFFLLWRAYATRKLLVILFPLDLQIFAWAKHFSTVFAGKRTHKNDWIANTKWIKNKNFSPEIAKKYETTKVVEMFLAETILWLVEPVRCEMMSMDSLGYGELCFGANIAKVFQNQKSGQQQKILNSF